MHFEHSATGDESTSVNPRICDHEDTIGLVALIHEARAAGLELGEWNGRLVVRWYGRSALGLAERVIDNHVAVLQALRLGVADFTAAEMARLQFVKWRVGNLPRAPVTALAARYGDIFKKFEGD